MTKASTNELPATTMSSVNSNLIDSAQWNSQWAVSKSPRRLRSWRDYLSWRFTRLFREYIRPGDRVLEIGCGGSRFLPYFAKELGAEVWGLDFAPAGILTAKGALLRAGVSGTILEGDLFTTTDLPESSFDVVFSAGFIEHFPQTANVVRHIARFAKPGTGLVITEIPNVCGWFFSKLQKRLDPDLYAQHVPITPAQMDLAHREAGARPVRAAQYFGTLGLGVINYDRALCRLPRRARMLLRRSLEIPQFVVTAPLWALRTTYETAAISPFILGVYQRSNF
jgi:2-polyprenyl-3-methyl-5-hydroxy-6-metoxy-1,4-benzoquinol methylase